MFTKGHTINRGRKQRPEWVAKRVASRKQYFALHPEKQQRGQNNPMFGKCHSPETKARMSARRKQWWMPERVEEWKQRIIRWRRTPEGRQLQSKLGSRPKPYEFGQLQSQIRKQQWQDPDWIAKLMEGLQKRPTEPEQKLIDICFSHFPNFKYNGDFSQGVVLQGLIPDFINCNGKKEVIEVFGDYWHSPKVTENDWKRTELGRIMAYNSLGYRCLVLWEHELKTLPEEEIVAKINKFTSARGEKKEVSHVSQKDNRFDFVPGHLRSPQTPYR